jgi:hypothetical protein
MKIHGLTRVTAPAATTGPQGSAVPRRRRWNRLAVAGVAASAGLTGLLPPAAAQAAGPERMTIDISESFTSDFWSAACGTPVVVSIVGSGEYTLWLNSSGLVARELDRFPSAFLTWSAPDLGTSVKTRADLVSRWDYGSGAVLGGPVTYEFHGLFAHVPGGTSAFAGREVSQGYVDSFDGALPGVDNGELVSLIGHFPDLDFVGAVCDQLT